MCVTRLCLCVFERKNARMCDSVCVCTQQCVCLCRVYAPRARVCE